MAKTPFSAIQTANIALPQSSLAIKTHFAIFHTYDIPNFQTEVLHLVSNEGRIKHLCYYING